jgi:micrococcal nuclease
MNRQLPVALVVLVLLIGGCVTLPASPTQSPATESQLPGTADSETYVVTVTEVVDGDTMHVRYRNGSRETIRLLGVDTPEVHTENDPAEFEGIPETEAGRQWLRDWGHKASEYARSQIAGEQVRVAVDDRADRRGSYGRLLVYVHHDDAILNRQLLAQGYARLYESSFSRRERFQRTEQRAREQGVGLWGFSSGSTATRSGSTAPLAVVQIHADAAGNDHENLNDEYVVFENRGDDTLDLSGWRVSDEGGHSYVFPDGFALEPGQRVTLYTGGGTDTETELYWGSDGAVWNNGGDTVVVRNERGAVVLDVSY